MATPPINVVGQFTVADPFKLEDGAIYKCESIRGFEELDSAGVDIYSAYYKDYGIEKEVYDGDRLNSVDIVTLVSVSADIITLPSSFITSFPNVESIPYQHTMLVFDVGILPDGFDLTGIEEHCRQIIAQGVGVDVDVATITHPVADVVDVSQHEQMTNARIANQNVTDSHYKRMLELEKEVQALRTRQEVLVKELMNYK